MNFSNIPVNAGPEELRWEVGGRSGNLALLNVCVTGNCGTNLVLVYPGSGADVLHPLFAAWGPTKYMVFIDPLDSLVTDIPKAIKEQYEALSGYLLDGHLSSLEIQSKPDGAWSFKFKNSERILLFFKQTTTHFLSSNPRFHCDIFFEKDFWETPEVNDFDKVLPPLRNQGIYTTNSTIGRCPFLSYMGLKQCSTVQLNGDQYVWQKIGPLPKTGTELMETMKEIEKWIANFLYADPGLAPFTPAGLKKEQWINLFCLTLVKIRQIILNKLPTFPNERIWDASTWILLWSYKLQASVYKPWIDSAQELAQQLSPNFASVVEEVQKFADEDISNILNS